MRAASGQRKLEDWEGERTRSTQKSVTGRGLRGNELREEGEDDPAGGASSAYCPAGREACVSRQRGKKGNRLKKFQYQVGPRDRSASNRRSTCRHRERWGHQAVGKDRMQGKRRELADTVLREGRAKSRVSPSGVNDTFRGKWEGYEESCAAGK